jgi:hypothetical protein
MFNDLHAGHNIKLAKALRRDFASAVVDRKTRQSHMRLCRRNIFRCGINTGNVPAKPRERFAEQTGTATNIQHGFARQRISRLRVATKMRIYRGPDEAQSHRV